MKNQRIFIAAITLFGAFLVIISAFYIRQKAKETEPLTIAPPVALEEMATDPVETEPESADAPLLYPVGAFGPDKARKDYVSGEMILKIPRLNFEGLVFSSEEEITAGSSAYQGVAKATLKKGVGLFGAAQIPTDSNSNVSIAGHRDVPFRDIDKITTGDYMYLEFRGKEYVYLYEETFVTDPYDWSAIKTKDFGCITLQSCTPVNVSTHRIFVVGRLMEINDLEIEDLD